MEVTFAYNHHIANTLMVHVIKIFQVFLSVTPSSFTRHNLIR